MAKSKNHYVNNSDFLSAMVEYKNACKESALNGTPKPRVPEYIGECLLKIAEHLSHKPNFFGYTFREDMIGNAIINCLDYIHNFDPEKSKNPFAYFTQIMYYSFLRSLDGEKKHQVLKFKVLENSELMGMVLTTQDSDSKEYENSFTKTLHSNLRERAHEYDEKKRTKRMSRKRGLGLSQFEEQQ